MPFQFSVFTVDSCYPSTDAISGMTITGGNGSWGGGIQNLGNLTVTNSTLIGNYAIYGGGIYSNGTLTSALSQKTHR